MSDKNQSTIQYPLRRLLIIDDDPEILELLSGYFRQEGVVLEVQTASSGGEALKMLEELDQPLAIVSDIRMPGMTGVQLLAELRRRRLDIPLVFITGDGTKETVAEALRMGAFDFLDKPFHLATIGAVVTRAIEVGLHIQRLRRPQGQDPVGTKRSQRFIELFHLSNHVARRGA